MKARLKFPRWKLNNALKRSGYPARTGTLLEPFESTTGWTHSAGTSKALDEDLAVQGQYALRFKPTSSLSTIEYFKTFTALDLADMGRVAAYVHLDDDYDWQCNSSVLMATRLLGAGTIYPLASFSSIQQNLVGGQWLIGHISLANAAVSGASIGDHQIRFRNTVTGAKVGNTAFDAAYYNVSGKARYIFSFDDARRETITDAFPVMEALGIKGVLNIPVAKVGTADRLTWEDIAVLDAARWSIQLNLTDDDNPITTFASPAAVMTNLNSARAEMASRGFKIGPGVCYSNGEVNDDGIRTEKASVTTAGGDRIMQIADVSGINVGDRIIAWCASRTCRVDAIGSGQITATEDLTAFSGSAAFVDDSGPFHGTKMQDAMLTGGVGYGRGTSEGDWFTQFGVTPRRAVRCPGFSSTGLTRAAWNTKATRAKLLGTNMDTYIHYVSDSPPGGSGLTFASFADFTGIMEDAAADRDAGLAEIVSYADLDRYDRNAFPPS